jgi:murein DD-endopeptidase MepM/ murein hydrolase activator NlpD
MGFPRGGRGDSSYGAHMRVYGPVEGRGRTNLDNARARGAHKPQLGTIDLGNEPPLFVDGSSNVDFDRSRVSVRWLSGTILTGLCGAALMGGAVFAALGDAKFAADPERVEPTVRSGAASRSTVRKSDRLPPMAEGSGARQVFRITTMTKVGEREVPRVKPLTRISSNLALSSSELTANLPRFNPQRALAAADSDTVAAERPDAAAPDAEVSFVTRDLASAMPRLRVAAVASMDDVMRKVREAANWTGDQSAPKYMTASLPSGNFGATTDMPANIYAPFEAVITEENITQLPKTAPQATGGNPGNERTVTIKKGDTLGAVLRDNSGAIPEEIKAIYAVLGERVRDGNLKEGQKLRILLSPVPGAQRLQPVRVMVVSDQNSVEAAVARSDLNNKYVSVDVQMAETPTTAQDDDDDEDGSGIRLYQSIYETALRNHVPRAVIDEMIKVYSYDVDFQRKARPGDSLEVIFTGDEQNADPKPDVMFASLTVGGEEPKRYYRYVSPDDGIVDYYDREGKSAKKFLVRKPVTDAIMRSGFGSRKHPILGYTKMHTGVDWAAPLGTPIYAAGNGEIEKAGWESGYGKYIRIKHNYGYETAYGHMTAFARGIEPGVKVHQGQLIGYVGSTGQSTGPHVHYEIIVNGRFVDPMRIRLPRGRVLEGAVLAAFERERDKIDGYMGPQPTRTAQAGPAR